MASKIPINVSAVMKEATDIDGAAHTPISVSLYIDGTAQGDLSSLVRSAFSGGGEQVRVSVQYVDAAPVAPNPADDIAVLVAGFGDWVGSEAARVRAAGVPVMVVSNMPSLVEELASAMGAPVPDGDMAAPVVAQRASLGRVVLDSVMEVAGVGEPAVPASQHQVQADSGDVIELDDGAKAALKQRMGEWVIAACHEKRLAFALAFEFVRRPLALEIVNANSMQNAGIGAVMFIPGADMPLMTLNQARMLLEIAAAYGKPMNVERAKELAFVVGGAFACRGVARQLAGLVPGLGWATKAGVAYAGTGAMGRAAIEYFEAGGDAAGFASMLGKLGNAASGVASRVASSPFAQSAAAVAKDAAWAAYDAFGTMRR